MAIGFHNNAYNMANLKKFIYVSEHKCNSQLLRGYADINHNFMFDAD
jgi:hypothetical protein